MGVWKKKAEIFLFLWFTSEGDRGQHHSSDALIFNLLNCEKQFCQPGLGGSLRDAHAWSSRFPPLSLPLFPPRLSLNLRGPSDCGPQLARRRSSSLPFLSLSATLITVSAPVDGVSIMSLIDRLAGDVP